MTDTRRHSMLWMRPAAERAKRRQLNATGMVRGRVTERSIEFDADQWSIAALREQYKFARRTAKLEPAKARIIVVGAFAAGMGATVATPPLALVVD